jgi:hypothetical protein
MTPSVSALAPSSAKHPKAAPAARRPAARDASTESGPGLVRRNLPLVTILGALAVVNLLGLEYYLKPIEDRMRDPLHAWLKPSGYVGQSAGLIAFGLFLFLFLYPLRKRMRRLDFLGKLNSWLDVHIVAGFVVPVLGAVHAAWRFQGIIGWGYFSMLMVALSGVVGKYLYVHIPRGRSGLALSLEEIESRRGELLEQIVAMTGLEPQEVEDALRTRTQGSASLGIFASLTALISSDFTRRRIVWRLKRKLRERNVARRSLDAKTLRQIARLARREVAMRQQLRVLGATQRLFRYWHVFHRPFSITAFAAVTIHVVLVVYLGVTWLW